MRNAQVAKQLVTTTGMFFFSKIAHDYYQIKQSQVQGSLWVICVFFHFS